jgi:hypothetical protein
MKDVHIEFGIESLMVCLNLCTLATVEGVNPGLEYVTGSGIRDLDLSKCSRTAQE